MEDSLQSRNASESNHTFSQNTFPWILLTWNCLGQDTTENYQIVELFSII